MTLHAQVGVPACAQLLRQQMLQICVHLHISACFHSFACGPGLPQCVWGAHVQSKGSALQHGVCFSQLRLSSVRSPPHTMTCRVRAGMEACPGGCTLPGFETMNIYGNLGHIFLVTSPFGSRGIAVGLYHSQALHG